MARGRRTLTGTAIKSQLPYGIPEPMGLRAHTYCAPPCVLGGGVGVALSYTRDSRIPSAALKCTTLQYYCSSTYTYLHLQSSPLHLFCVFRRRSPRAVRSRERCWRCRWFGLVAFGRWRRGGRGRGGGGSGGRLRLLRLIAIAISSRWVGVVSTAWR